MDDWTVSDRIIYWFSEKYVRFYEKKGKMYDT